MDLASVAGAGLGGSVVALVVAVSNIFSNARKDRQQANDSAYSQAMGLVAEIRNQMDADRERSAVDRQRLTEVEKENELLRTVIRSLRVENDELVKRVSDCQRQIYSLTEKIRANETTGTNISDPPGLD